MNARPDGTRHAWCSAQDCKRQHNADDERDCHYNDERIGRVQDEANHESDWDRGEQNSQPYHGLPASIVHASESRAWPRQGTCPRTGPGCCSGAAAEIPQTAREPEPTPVRVDGSEHSVGFRAIRKPD